MRNFLATRIVRRFLGAEGETKRKRMVIMIGPPAAGKGFFLGEPEKIDAKDVEKGKAKKEEVGNTKKYKTEKGESRDTTFGYRLPKSTQGLFKDEDVPDRPDYDESDNHLRAIQFEEATQHFNTLKKAHEEGEDAYAKAMKDMWYNTKDGKRVDLAPLVPYDKFPASAKDFHKTANVDFYVSMRGWHNDADEKNAETGKPKERFKDEARHRFDDNVGKNTEGNASSGMMIIDSAGEDIDTQDFKGQIEHAKSNGYEVSVLFLHPEKADTELSNLARNRVNKKRMVDGSDIDNWYKHNEDALKSIQNANPDNFIHYRKGPPDSDPAKAKAIRAKARDLMEKLKDLSGDELEAAKKEINGALYDTPYELQKDTSYGRSLDGLPKEPKKNIAKAVKEMNDDAARREGGSEKKEEKPKEDESKSKGDSKDDEGDKKSAPKKDEGREKTRTKFLDDAGDKEVPNPTYNATKGESSSNPRRRKIRNLPWEHQKKYYEQWSHAKHAKTTALVFRRYVEASMQINAAEEEKPVGFIKGWMTDVAKKLKDAIKVEGYEIEVKSGAGPIVFLTLKGAEGDITALRKVKPSIMKALDQAVKDNIKNIPDGVKPRIRSSTHGNDMVITCEFMFP